ncbi:MAG: hypothetical protein ACK4NS_05720 [Saprospiraceae bacterium]
MQPSRKLKRLARFVAVTLLIGGAITVMVLQQTASIPVEQIKMLAERVALGYVVMGMVFFVANRFGMMIVCMGCAAAICFYFVELVR